MHLVALAFFLQGAATPPTIPVVGCNRFQVTITQPAVVSIRGAGGRGCGPLSISVDSGARYDRKSRTLTLPIALKNNGNRALVGPARLISWPDSFFLSTYGGVLPKGREYYIIPSNADSALGTPSMRNGKSYFWRYNSLIGAPPHAGALQPGERSRARAIKIKLEEGSASDFTIVLHAEAWNPHVFPVHPPIVSPSDLLIGAPVVVDAGELPGRVLSDIVAVRIPSDVPLAERQSVLDKLRGDVIGATASSGNDPRTYYVRLAPDSGAAPILSRRDQFHFGWRSPDERWTGVRPIFLDSLLAPDQPRTPLFLSAVRGCATVRVNLSATGAVGDVVPGTGCGPIAPVMISLAEFDHEKRIVRIGLVLTNEWKREVVAPIRALLWNDSIDVTLPFPPSPAPMPPRPPLTPGGRPPPPPPPPVPRSRWAPREPDPRVQLFNPDSAIGEGALALASAKIWRFDTLLPDSGGRPTLMPGTMSGERIVEFQLSSAPVEEFTFRVRAMAENAHPVPPVSPSSGDPPGAFDPKHWIRGRAGFGAMPVLDDLIDVTFWPYAEQQEMQAPVDSIHGQVVGGFRRPAVHNGSYVVRIPADTTGETLASALKTIRSFEKVLIAMPIEAERGAVRYDPEIPLVVGGCATIRVDLPAHAASVIDTASPYCGPIIPLIAGAVTFDSATSTARIPVVLRNHWTRAVGAPLELYAWLDSITSADGSQRHVRDDYWMLPPTPGWSDNATISSGSRWSFDALVTQMRGNYAAFVPGGASGVQKLAVVLRPVAPRVFDMRLRVQARHLENPDLDTSYRAGRESAADHEKFADGFYKYVINVVFRSGASRSAIQAALDSVRGTVIGRESPLDWNYVHISTDGSRAAIDKAVARLKSMPQISYASIRIDLQMTTGGTGDPGTPRPPDSTAAPARKPPS